jgi:pimeloyl-ACP methyl ester carboxylesterase
MHAPDQLKWTQHKARLQLIKVNGPYPLDWLFLAGGPGLGSESLAPLTTILSLPGKIWHLDLPGDGSNHTENDTASFAHWQQALIEAVSSFAQPILVGHSTGGMYALATAELEKHLVGLVLMDSAPNASWQQYFSEYVAANPLPQLHALHEQYTQNPTNELLREMTILSAPYLFTERGIENDLSFLKDLPYNFKSCDWSARHFDTSYHHQWVPNVLPTLIFHGQHDHITPVQLFQQDEKFQRSNIQIKIIPHAAHFPWIENPKAVIAIFNEYAESLCHLLTKHNDEH